MSDRLEYALSRGGLVLPDGAVALFGPPGDSAARHPVLEMGRDLSVVQGFRPDLELWARQGVPVSDAPQGPYACVIVTLPRARDLAEHLLALACAAAPDGMVVLDGAKTDGIEALAKALKPRVTIDGTVSKAHGKCLWFRASDALADWHRAPSRNAGGDLTAPGVFSADGADPASRALAAALPPLKGRFADLGAGWGWLSREILRHEAVRALHLVEADKAALDCARVNVTDPRAAFHWADAATWQTPETLDGIVMNPPFHQGRKADPKLGQGFIATAARLLPRHGRLWMVANRHLPYETTLERHFAEHAELAGDARFKILTAARPRPQR